MSTPAGSWETADKENNLHELGYPGFDRDLRVAMAVFNMARQMGASQIATQPGKARFNQRCTSSGQPPD